MRPSLLVAGLFLLAAIASCSSGPGSSHSGNAGNGFGGAGAGSGGLIGGAVGHAGAAGKPSAGAAGSRAAGAGAAGAGAGDSSMGGEAEGAGSAGMAGQAGSVQGSTVGMSGGSVAGPHGTSITVPEGALSGDVFFEIAEGATDAPSLPAGMLTLSPIYAFTPHGTEFAKPVTVRVAFDAASAPSGVPRLLRAEPGGAFTEIPAQVEGDAMTATVSSFSWFVVVQLGDIQAGYFHTCAQANGGIECWGDNSFGELGDGSTTSSPRPLYVKGLPQLANALPGVTPTLVHSIALNYDYSCALLGAGYGVMCWGQNSAVPSGSTTMPVTVSGLALASAISAGVQHACALMPGGTVKCWGSNLYGELGDDSTMSSATPVGVSGLSGAVALSANGNTSCAVLGDGTARCWGRNDSGQLGDGTWANSASPMAVKGLNGVTSISLGWFHGCALLADGTARCWGVGDGGELGDGLNMSSPTPVTVSGLTGAVAISAGLDNTCALLSNGTATCWGTWGSKITSLPTVVSGLTNVATISVGFGHRCAMLSDGTALCWGENANGQLGDGSLKSSGTPVIVPLGNSTGGASGAGGTGGAGGAGGGVNGSCFNTLYHQGTTASDCSVTEEDGSAMVAMVCTAASCQCNVNGVAYGAPTVGSPCADAIGAFQQMYTQCGCP